jgi:hypothetical protein
MSGDSGDDAKKIAAATAVNPYLGLFTAGVSALGNVMKGGGPAGPSGVDSDTEAMFDSSGWTLNFGDGATVSPSRSQVPQLGGLNTTVIVAIVGALVAWKIWNKRRK